MPAVDPDPILIELIRALMNAPDWDAAREFTLEHPELLTAEAEMQFSGLSEIAFAHDDPDLARQITLHQGIMRHAREEGVDTAFAHVQRDPDPALSARLSDFIGAANWAESRAILNRNPLLISDESLAILESAIREAIDEGEKQTAFTLNMHLELLQDARALGYEKAFARLEAPPDEAIAAVIMDLIAAGENPESARAFIEAHPVLMNDEADHTFGPLIQGALALGNIPQANWLISYRDLLREARRKGLEAAFSLTAVEPSGEVKNEDIPAERVLEMIVESTLAVMTVMPDKRPDWMAVLAEIGKEARGMGDVMMGTLVAAIGDLVMGKDEPAPSLTGPYAEAWSRLSAALRE